MTLRLRLLLGLVAIVAVGLFVSDIATFTSLRSFLLSRIDAQLEPASQPMLHALIDHVGQAPFGFAATIGPGPGGQGIVANRPGETGLIPPGSFAEIRDSSGTLLASDSFDESLPAPILPAALPGSGLPASSSSRPFSARSSSEVHYRVLAQPLVDGSGNVIGTLVVAFPLSEVDRTLHRLFGIESLVTIAVLFGLGALAWWIVRRGLRPLEDMANTAGAIAAGDLSRRVPYEATDERTEVGRLGLALNTMLGEIEKAFQARSASEERLRRFLADASHELRTPLTSIRGYAEMFERGARDRPEDLQTSMSNISSEAARMASLVEDLLLLARLDRERPLQKTAVDLTSVAAASVEAVRVGAPDRHVEFQAQSKVSIEADPDRLRQVADNLITNALRHAPSNSPIEVRVRREASWGVLEVRDRGPGIPEEERDKIFEPFYRADQSRARATGGAGLGLAIVKAIVEAHGGRAGVNQNEPDGAVFWIRLPAVATSSAGDPPSADTDVEPRAKTPGGIGASRVEGKATETGAKDNAPSHQIS